MKMKNKRIGIILLIVLVVVLQACSSSENKRNEFDNVSIKTVNIFEEISEGGIIKGVYKNDELIQISSVYYGSLGKNEYLIYFDDDVVLVNKYSFEYDAPISADDTLISSSQLEQYVLIDDQVYLSNEEDMQPIDNNELFDVVNEMKEQLGADHE